MSGTIQSVNAISSRWQSSLVFTLLIGAFLLVVNVLEGAYLGMHYPRPPRMAAFRIIEYLVVWILIAMWMKSDARKSNLGWTIALGNWIYLVWPAVAPSYLWSTRRAKGFVPIVVFIIIFVVSTVVGAFVYTLFIF